MSGFLKQLSQDTAGNTLAIFAAALIPMVMMVGSGLDLGTTYMARAKLQNACDAGVLAGRQVMEGNAWTDDVRNEAHKFFDFNFPNGTHNVSAPVFTVAQDSSDPANITGTASGSVPTSLMYMFGFDALPIEVGCDAKRDLGHNDVMLVLDVTGSMASAPTIGGDSKIVRLRRGTTGLWRALDDSANGSVTRFGIVPYSHTVNVGGSLTDNDIRDENKYVGIWAYRQWTRNVGWNWRFGPRKISGWIDDDNYVSDGDYGQSAPVWYDRHASDNYSPDRGYIKAEDSTWGSKSSFRTSSSGGCIEERSSIGGGNDPIAIGGTITRDDIDQRATGDATPELQFGRYDPGILYHEHQSGCPSPARRLAPYTTESAYKTAVNNATAKVTGGTYHDVGILWGARFLSSTGWFASDNPTERNNVAVNKHIVFMTDGILDVDDKTGHDLYSAHGLERFYGRTQGGGTNLQNHRNRFLSACSTAKAMGMTIWVIALDVTNSDDIRPCATSEGHFFESDGSDLEDKFETIGQGIGNLRLTR